MTNQTNVARTAADHAAILSVDEERRIRARAYEIWEEEGRRDGLDQEHWLRAKWELEHGPEPSK